MKTNLQILPYGRISAVLSKQRGRAMRYRGGTSKSSGKKQAQLRLYVTHSQDLDLSFVSMVRREAPGDSRLLILNEGTSADRILSRIIDMQIRTPQRFYVFESSFSSKDVDCVASLCSLLERLVSAFESDNNEERILDARIENGILHIVSPSFARLDVPIEKITEFKSVDTSVVQEFEIDEDGAFLYWPKLDVHLGWRQLQQAVDPDVVYKAQQRSEAFNVRYGKAVRLVREQADIKRREVNGLSEKQLRRIEKGECRLTANAVEALAHAHGLKPSGYMQRLAEVSSKTESAIS